MLKRFKGGIQSAAIIIVCTWIVYGSVSVVDHATSSIELIGSTSYGKAETINMSIVRKNLKTPHFMPLPSESPHDHLEWRLPQGNEEVEI
ncbi:MAG TPA: hypothetical protein VD928_02900 [Candidatus Paceibacterota bacterium]|nr:hypothetical protein [Candidatus Paceibacterota bacterium]